jgi:ribose/xylose/arabinose/galactoside ABC-type transport system permease subunit
MAFLKVERINRFLTIAKNIVKNHTVIILFLILFIIASLLSRAFFSLNNISNILLQNAIIGFLAVGQTLVIISGGIDLSVGATLALTTMVCALLAPYGIFVSLFSGLAIGVAIGLINGLLVTKLKMIPFIVTLATMGIITSIAAILTGGEHVNTDLYRFLNNWNLGIMPFMVLIWILLTVLFQYLLNSRTSIHYMLAVGGDEETARLSGIKTSRIKVFAYILSGILSSVGAIFYLARLGDGHYSLGGSFNLDSIAAVIIGGASIFGGKGSIVDTFFGVIILGIIENIINLLNISVYVKDAFKGVIILVIILFAVIRRNRELQRISV